MSARYRRGMSTPEGPAQTRVDATITADYHWRYVAAEAVAAHRAQHEAAELASLLALLAHTPNLRHVLEIGGGSGGSAWAWSQLPRVTSILTVSLDPPWLYDQGPGQRAAHVAVQADSTRPSTVAEVRSLIPGSGFDLVVIDGGHDERTVRADWHNYGPMCRPGGLIVLHDTRDGQERDQLQVSRLWRELAMTRATIELHAHLDGPAGTGIVLA